MAKFKDYYLTITESNSPTSDVGDIVKVELKFDLSGWNIVNDSNNGRSLVIEDCRVVVRKNKLRDNIKNGDNDVVVVIYGRIMDKEIDASEFEYYADQGLRELQLDSGVMMDLVVAGTTERATSMYLKRHGLTKSALRSSQGVAERILLIKNDDGVVKIYSQGQRPFGPKELREIQKNYDGATLKYVEEVNR